MKTLQTLNKKKTNSPPIWIMRQAGRYLKEFKNVKKKTGGFIKMVYNPKIASKITLQPIKKFGFDSAIIFSDILVIPDSLGQKLTYKDKEGPKLEPMEIEKMIKILKIEKDKEKLKRTYEAIKKTKQKINNKKTSLIGFVGAPLTISFFMLDSLKEKKYKKILLKMKRKKKQFNKLIKILETAIIKHALKQIKAGAQIIQIFDTWACAANKSELQEYSIKPIKRICANIKKKAPKIPIIVFPRKVKGSYTKYISPYVDCISVAEDITQKEINEIQKKKIIQGNLSPRTLAKGGLKLEIETKKVFKRFSKGPFIFNLSHGILPKTPVENVKKLIKLVRSYKK